MAIVPVAQLKNGSKLADPVLTKKGNLLLEKGKVINDREREILQAFLISLVSVESKEDMPLPLTEEAGRREAGQADTPEAASFAEKVKRMKVLLKRVFNVAAASQPLPVLEIRTNLIEILDHADEFHVLLTEQEASSGEDYLFNNSIYVAITAYLLAKWHGLSQKDWLPAAMGGLLHNIGHVKVDSAILDNQAPLTPEEREEMQKHTIFGYQVIKNLPAVNEGVKYCALQHHEREDGSGYPMGVKGDKIHPYAKIVAIADIYHAMTSNRSYKQAVSPYKVLDELYEESFGKLDPALVQTFIGKITAFTKGAVVRLSDGRVGEIVFTELAHPTRPWVKIGNDIVNLVVQRQLHIEQLLITVKE